MNLINTLKRHEGSVTKDNLHIPYKDSSGHLTIGYGHLLENGIPEHIVEELLLYDIQIAKDDLKKVFPNFIHFSQARKHALISMMFNLGLTKFRGFKKMIKAIENKDWSEAKRQALDSRWATQVKSRAEEIADALEQG